MHQLPIFPGLLPLLLHHLLLVSQQQPTSPATWAAGQAGSTQVCEGHKAWEETLGGSSKFSKSQRHLEGWPGEWACSNKHFQPWLESPQVTCVQHFRIYKAIFIPCTSVHSHDNPMRQDLIFALKMRKPKLREFRWLSPDQLAESGMKFTTSD